MLDILNIRNALIVVSRVGVLSIFMFMSFAGFGQPIVIDNGLISLYFDGESFTLQQIEDWQTGSIIEFAPMHTPIWRVNLLDTTLHPVPIDGLIAIHSLEVVSRKAFSIDTLAVGPILHMRWDTVQLDSDQLLNVNVDILVPWGEGLSYWRLTIENMCSTYAIFSIDFPVLALYPIDSDPDDDILVLPALSGTIVKNPFFNATQMVTNETDLSNFGGCVMGCYPGSYVMQFELCYDSTTLNGLYLATNDTVGYAKRYNNFHTPDNSKLIYFVRHYPENNNRIQHWYTIPYDCIVGPFTGDWISAAKFYRTWATQQHWCSNGSLRHRVDFPSSAANIALTIINEGSEFGDIVLMLNSLIDWKQFFGDTLCLVSHLRGWGNWLPYVEFYPGVDELVDSLITLGIRVAPYTNTRLWHTYTPDDNEGTRAASVAKNINLDWYLDTRYDAYVMDPSTETWRDKYAYIVHTLHTQLGVTDLYVDNFPTFKLCYEPAHGHTVGGGSYWINGFVELARQVREAERSIEPDFTMTQECRVEFEIPVFDFLFVQYWESPPDTGSPGLPYVVSGGDPIPLFACVYHDYVGMIGSPMKRWEWYGDNHFAFAYAYSFVNGNRLILYDDVEQIDEFVPTKLIDMKYLRRLVYNLLWGNEYLLYGEWMRPPKVDAPLVAVELSDTVRYFAKVLAGAFKVDDRLGIPITNFTSDTTIVMLTVELENYDLPADEYVVNVIDSTGSHAIDSFVGNIYIREFVFTPKSAMILEILPKDGAVTERASIMNGLQIYPNPCSKRTIIEYQSPCDGVVTLKIYDITGRLVKSLVNRWQKSGTYTVVWDGRDINNKPVPSGVYFVQLQAGDKCSKPYKVLRLKAHDD